MESESGHPVENQIVATHFNSLINHVKLSIPISQLETTNERDKKHTKAARCNKLRLCAGAGNDRVIRGTQSYMYFCKTLFPWLEPVTFWSHDNNFTNYDKLSSEQKNKK